MAIRNIIFAALVVATCMEASAATKTWTGAGASANWSDGANWADLTAPGTGDHLVFPAGASRTTSTNDLSVTLDGFDVAGAGYVFTGNLLTLSGTAAVSVTAAGASFDAQVEVSLTSATPNIVIATTPGSFPTATARFSGSAIDTVPGRIFMDAGTGWIVVNSSITEMGVDSLETNFEMHGAKVTLSQPPWMISGTIDTYAGILEVTRNGNFGAETRIFGTVQAVNSIGTYSLVANKLTFAGTGAGAGSGDLAAFGPFSTVVQDMNIPSGTVYLQPVADIEVGYLHGNGTVVIDHGDGALVLPSSYNPFVGTIDIRRGGLRTSACCTFSSPGSLGLASATSINVEPGGTWFDYGTAIAGLRCSGMLSVTPDPGSFGPVHATSGADITGCRLSLVIPPSLTPASDSVYEIVVNTTSPIVGTFSGLPEGSIVNVNGTNMTMTYLRDGGRRASLVANYQSVVASRLEAVSPPSNLMKASGSVLTGLFSARALNGQGSAFAGARVTFSAQAGCGSFAGASSADVVTGADGIAVAPAFTTGDFTGDCTIQASTAGVTGAVSFPFYVYRSSDLSVQALPSAHVTIAVNQSFQVGVQIAGPQGRFISGAQVSFQVVSGGSSGASLVASSVTTGTTGVAMASAMANGVAGNYSISVAQPAGVTTILVEQHATVVNPPPPTAPLVQDMWWAGSAENGWGMSLVQHDDILFGAMYIYDANGKPTWLVLPGGAWDATKTVYSGSLYTPAGTPFFAYDTSRLVVGGAKGSVTITFQDASNATLDYTIGGLSGRKLITREIFANGAAAGTDRSDLWWGGSVQNGWGITILQQAQTLFPIWYTYDANGVAIWYVMPGGTWTTADTYEGRVYRTTGSPWAGAQYDPTKLQVFDVGTYRIQFNGDSASFNYSVDGHSATMPLVREPF